MQPRVSWLPLAILTLTSVACVRVSTTRIAPARASVAPDSVQVFATRSPSEYTELAVLRAHRFLASDTRVLEALRRRAARLGANGLLLLNTRGSGGVRGTGSGVVVTGPRSGDVVVGNVQTEVDEFARAVAIVYRGG
jgi:hypothetical protein